MSRDALAANRLLQFPTLIGAIVPIVKLPQVREGELKLTGALLANIYAGNIRKWNASGSSSLTLIPYFFLKSSSMFP